jgi:predicted TPR repeat methyltransferase
MKRMSELVSDEDRDEMAIPSYLHPNAPLRWMAWRRIDEVAALYRKHFPIVSAEGNGIKVMDYGCGTGVLFDELCQAAEQVCGVDIVLEPARLLVGEWDLERVSLMDPATAAASIATSSLDAIVAAEVLEHIDPLDDTLEFFRDRLKPTGKLLVSVPTENALYRFGRRLAGFENHYHESNAEAIHRKILAIGFRELGITRIPAPGPLAIYWVVAYGLS